MSWLLENCRPNLHLKKGDRSKHDFSPEPADERTSTSISLKHSTCRDCLVFNVRRQPYSWTHDLRSLRKSADRGCPCCADILHAIQLLRPWFSSIDDKKQFELSTRLTSPRQAIVNVRGITLEFGGQPASNYLLNVARQPRNCVQSYLLVDNTLATAASWLDECVGLHPRCRASNKSFIPHRLVHLRGENLVLETGFNLLNAIQYAALSYCWGSGNNGITTTRETLQAHSQSINFSALPKTLQDAVVVCRYLHVEYLWVDSLCIVQDDIESRDWYQESSKIDQIFSNAHVTIAANVSSDSAGGFLGSSKLSSKFYYPSRGTCVAYVVSRDVQYTHSHASKLSSVLPLSRRGWTLQETLLSKRIIYFTPYEIVWECNESNHCQCGYTNYSITKTMFRALAEEVPLNPSLSQRFSTRRLSAGSVDSATGVYITNFIRAPNRDRLYYAWQTIIADYSERALTILSDKLPAISGLAKVLLRACNSDTERYLAGLWYENLPWGLLWYVCGPPIHFRPSSPAIAPSWSWASLVGRIEYFCNSYQFGFASNVKILEAGCLLRSTDPTGAVRGGFIRLEGCLIPVSLRIETTDSPTQSEYTGKAGCASRASPNTTVSVSSVSSQRSRWYEILYDEIRWDSTAHTPQLETQSVRDREFFCLEIGASFDRKLYGHTARFRTLGYGSRMWWLVLEATTQNDGSRAYRRVGLGYWHMKMSTSDTGLYYLFDGAYPQEVTLI